MGFSAKTAHKLKSAEVTVNLQPHRSATVYQVPASTSPNAVLEHPVISQQENANVTRDSVETDSNATMMLLENLHLIPAQMWMSPSTQKASSLSSHTEVGSFPQPR